MKLPRDRKKYQRDPRSEPIHAGLEDGCYVYVRDRHGTIFVLPDGPHLHAKVMGGAEPAMYAGDFTKSSNRIIDLTNLSGTFQFSEPEGLLSVAHALKELGFQIVPGSVRLFSHVDNSRPRVLR